MERISKENFVECVANIKKQAKNLDRLDEYFPEINIWDSRFSDPIFMNVKLLAYCLAGDDNGYTEENLANVIWEKEYIDWEKFYDSYTN